MQKYDVLVVGGGPGGIIAGKIAAEKGLKTIIFERGRKCGEKNASGVGLVPKIWRDFPEIMKDMDLPSQRVSRMSTAHLCDKKGEILCELTWSPSQLNDYKEAREFMVVMVYRSQFDHWLSKYAVDAGAELKTSTLIIDVLRDDDGKIIGVVDEDGTKYTGVIIGADGAVSTIAHKSGIRPKFGPNETTLVVNYDFEAPEKKIDEIIGDNCLHNWFSPIYPACFNFFKKDGFHIGLGQWYGAIDQNILVYLNRVIKSPPVARLIKKLNAKPRELHAHALPWQQFPITTYGENVMLIGDSAGFPCPLEAEGIWHAMYSGRLAALNALDAIENNDFSKEQMKKYETAWIDSPLGDEFIAGKELQEFWAGLSFNMDNIGKTIDLTNNFLNIFTGATSHVDMGRKVFQDIRDRSSELAPLVRKYLIPFFARLFEKELEDFSSILSFVNKLSDDIKPKSRDRRKK
ncbi:MAG: NAD(P)/FAD-dependent oxidoreductase [Candidatus Helarchaeota archaeon]